MTWEEEANAERLRQAQAKQAAAEAKLAEVRMGFAKFHCPYCSTTTPPVEKSNISQGGWILFVVFLVVCFPVCFLGLLIREKHKYCASCGMKLD